MFSFFSRAFDVCSHLILSTIFILIANGWTIKNKRLPNSNFLVSIVSLVWWPHIGIVLLGMFSDDAYYKYSHYDGILGYFLILFRILLYFAFLYCWFAFYKSLSKSFTTQFLEKFNFLCSVYFLSFPAIVIIS